MAVATDTSGKIVKSTCPHCGTKGVAFTIDAVHHRPQPFGVSDQWDTFAVCGLCGRGVIAVFEASKDGLYGRTREDFFSAYPRLLGVLPPPPSLGAPRHTPKNVASFVRQAKASLPEKSWDASVIMSRKALEAALKDKFDDLGDRLRLVDRIDEAAKQGYLTSDLAKWAHHIRLGGNTAAHDDQPISQKDAEQLELFTNLVLLYLYTLPGMLKEARGETETDDAEKSSA